MLVSIIVLSAIFATAIAPYDPAKIQVAERLQGPSATHWLGTDQLGRDVLSRALVGGRIALFVALSSIGLALAIGGLLGLIAGYGPRWLDALLVLIFDSVRSFPLLMFALAVVTILGPSLGTIIFIIVIFQAPAYGRVVRTQTMSLKHTEFVVAARAISAGWFRIICVHLLPNIIGPPLILASMDVPSVITVEAGLSFLGLGVRPPTPSWGNILNDGYNFIRSTPWIVIAGGLPLILATLGFTFVGEGLRDAFDPRLRPER